MSVTILTPDTRPPDRPFYLPYEVFELVCKTVEQAARKKQYNALAEECELAVITKILNFADVPPGTQTLFGQMLRAALRNGSIIKEMLSWPSSSVQTPQVLPQNQTHDVVSYFVVEGSFSEMWRIAEYLLRDESLSSQASS